MFASVLRLFMCLLCFTHDNHFKKNSTLAMQTLQTFLPFPTNTELVSHPAYAWNPGRDLHLLEPMFDAMFHI